MAEPPRAFGFLSDFFTRAFGRENSKPTEPDLKLETSIPLQEVSFQNPAYFEKALDKPVHTASSPETIVETQEPNVRIPSV